MPHIFRQEGVTFYKILNESEKPRKKLLEMKGFTLLFVLQETCNLEVRLIKASSLQGIVRPP